MYFIELLDIDYVKGGGSRFWLVFLTIFHCIDLNNVNEWMNEHGNHILISNHSVYSRMFKEKFKDDDGKTALLVTNFFGKYIIYNNNI